MSFVGAPENPDRTGKQGRRVAPSAGRRPPVGALAPAAGAVIGLGLWAYLVWSAIHFGSRARGGNASDWGICAAMTIGAIAALFVALYLATQASRAAGLTAAPHPRANRVKGGKRAAR